MAAQRCLDSIAATPRVSGRDDAAPLDLAAPASDLRAARYVGDRPRHGRAAWHMTSAAREPMLRPDAVLSAAAPPARVDVSRPLDPLRCSDLSYHMMLFLCFARFIRSLLFFRLLMTACPYWIQTTPFDCKKTARSQCCTSLRVAFNAARRRAAAASRAALQHCSILLLQTSQWLTTAMRARRGTMRRQRRPPRTRPSLRRRASVHAQSHRRDETRRRRCSPQDSFD